MVWMIRRSGRRTRQTSFTPSAQIWGLSPCSPNRSMAEPASSPCDPSASTVRPATTSDPGSKFASFSPERPRPHDRSREKVGARLLSLLEHRHGNVSELLADVRALLEQLAEADRAGETCGPCSHDQDTDIDPLLGRVGGHADRIARAEGGR